MCGIVGIVGRSPVNQTLYDALTLLQHRGQDAAGIVTSDGNKFHLRKEMAWLATCFVLTAWYSWSVIWVLAMYVIRQRAVLLPQKLSHFM